MHITIELNESEIVLIEAIAKWRNSKARGFGIKDRMIDTSRSSIAIDIEGMKGEWAVAKYFDVPINMILQPTGDGGIFDFSYKDCLIEVKATRYPQGLLILGMNKEIKADVYILTIIDNNKVYIRGCISKQRFIELNEVKCLNGTTKCRSITQDLLRPVDLLKAWLDSEK